MNPTVLKRLAIIALATLVAACNTVQGAGQDVQSIGRAGERALDAATR
jgi:predicted small secreted protein